MTAQLSPIGPAKRQRIIQAARREFLAHGFKATDLAVFAAALGISKKTLYQQFASKRDLVAAVLADKIAGVEAALSAILKGGEKEPHDLKIRRFIECLQHELGEVKPPFLRDLNRFHPELFQLVSTARRKIIPEYFGALIARGQKDGAIRRDIPKKIIVQIFLALAESIMTPEKMLELGITPRKGFDYIFAAVLGGIQTEGGHSAG